MGQCGVQRMKCLAGCVVQGRETPVAALGSIHLLHVCP